MNLQKTILGSIISDHSIHDLAIPKLNIKHFKESYRWLVDTIQRMYSNGEPIDLLTLAKKVDDRATMSISEINQLMSVSPSDTRNIIEYIEILRNDYLRDWVYARLGVELKHSDDPIEYLTDYIRELETLKSDSYAEGRSLLDIIEDAMQPDQRGLITNITRLNKLDVLKPARLVAIGGRPSHGKTQFAMDLVRTVCEAGKKALVFSLEMTDKELIRRYLDGGVDPGDLSAWNLKILDRSGVGVDYIVSNSRIEKPDLIVIDYLGFVRLPTDRRPKTEKIGDVTKSLKGLSKDINCPVVLLVQANRQIESRTNKMHQMDDLADSAEIERDSDVVAFILRPELYGIIEYAEDGLSTEKSAVLQVVKNRHGMTDYIRMSIEGFKFTDYGVFN